MNRYTKTLLSFLAASVLLCGALFQSGCTTTGADGEETSINPYLIKTAVQVAVLEYIGDDVDKAIKIASLASKLIALVDHNADATTVDLLIEYAKDEIDWQDMLPAEKALALNLIEFVASEAKRLVLTNQATTPSEVAALNRMDLEEVLLWVHEAAQMHQLGARAE